MRDLQSEITSRTEKAIMVDLKLNDREFRTLERTLARRSQEMLNELVHTTDKSAHAELKASFEELEALYSRVKGLAAAV